MVDFDDTFFGMFGFVAVIYGLIGFLLPFLVIYVLGYVRRRRDDNPDLMLGAKVFLALLMSISIQIIIFGICLMVAEGLEDKPAGWPKGAISVSDPAWNVAKGLVYGGLLAAVYPTALYVLLRRRHRGPDSVQRSALGVNAIFTGLVFVVSVTSLMVTVSLETVTTTNNQTALTVVYLIAGLGFGAPLALSAPRQAPPRRSEPITATVAPTETGASAASPAGG